MTSLLLDLCSIQDVSGRGRGVIATQGISVDTVLLRTGPPAAYVIFSQYRKEICAHCFRYDRGRRLPVRSPANGKHFCSRDCEDYWIRAQNAHGLEAWTRVYSFVQTTSRSVQNNRCQKNADGKPGMDKVAAAWEQAEHLIKIQHKGKEQALARRKTGSRVENCSGRPLPASCNGKVNPDQLGFLLSGIQLYHDHPERWAEDILTLAHDEEPYCSSEDLEAHVHSLLQLTAILPETLVTSCKPEVCRDLVNVTGHNSFDINAGGEDGEEYVGCGLYPAASYFNHSCSPNIAKRRDGHGWTFRAARNIAIGEECCITYLGGEERCLSMGDRRDRLKAFVCMCPACEKESTPTTVQ